MQRKSLEALKGWGNNTENISPSSAFLVPSGTRSQHAEISRERRSLPSQPDERQEIAGSLRGQSSFCAPKMSRWLYYIDESRQVLLGVG